MEFSYSYQFFLGMLSFFIVWSKMFHVLLPQCSIGKSSYFFVVLYCMIFPLKIEWFFRPMASHQWNQQIHLTRYFFFSNTHVGANIAFLNLYQFWIYLAGKHYRPSLDITCFNWWTFLRQSLRCLYGFGNQQKQTVPTNRV